MGDKIEIPARAADRHQSYVARCCASCVHHMDCEGRESAWRVCADYVERQMTKTSSIFTAESGRTRNMHEHYVEKAKETMEELKELKKKRALLEANGLVFTESEKLYRLKNRLDNYAKMAMATVVMKSERQKSEELTDEELYAKTLQEVMMMKTYEERKTYSYRLKGHPTEMLPPERCWHTVTRSEPNSARITHNYTIVTKRV